jgi:hypothetical protein
MGRAQGSPDRQLLAAVTIMRIEGACVVDMRESYQGQLLLQWLEGGHPPERASVPIKQQMEKSCNLICGEQNCFMSTLRHNSWIMT